jgi:DhnA family fructose-bisphosphate aldolase class Ia
MDHGLFNGLYPGLENLPRTVQRTLTRDADGILVAPGMFPHIAESLAYRGAPVGIVRLLWNSIYRGDDPHAEAPSSRMIGPEDALAMGADWAIAGLTLKTGSEERDARNVELFSDAVSRAHRLGLPILGECYPNLEGLTPDQVHETVATGVRALAELGADAIKTPFTTHFEEITAGVPIPVLGLGGEKTPHEIDALRLAQQITGAGARGVVFGRNVFQAADPGAFLAALCDVVKAGVAPEEAAASRGLEVVTPA